MPCGTCGSSGHNTTTCTVRKVTEGAAGVLGGFLGGAVGAHAGHPHVGHYVGKEGAKALAHEGMMTKSQIAYRERNN